MKYLVKTPFLCTLTIIRAFNSVSVLSVACYLTGTTNYNTTIYFIEMKTCDQSIVPNLLNHSLNLHIVGRLTHS